ncbi:MAG: hypothetical protein WA990_07985 [Rubrobacteraceae bacterium]
MNRDMGDSRELTHLEPSQESGGVFLGRGIEGSVVMLNLLRFREVADYSATPELAPPDPISGAAAYQLYMEHSLPYLQRVGSTLMFLGEGGDYLVGPPGEGWDVAMLVRHQSVESFMSFAANDEYLAGAGHRTAALADSRLLPLVERRAV